MHPGLNQKIFNCEKKIAIFSLSVFFVCLFIYLLIHSQQKNMQLCLLSLPTLFMKVHYKMVLLLKKEK